MVDYHSSEIACFPFNVTKNSPLILNIGALKVDTEIGDVGNMWPSVTECVCHPEFAPKDEMMNVSQSEIIGDRNCKITH